MDAYSDNNQIPMHPVNEEHTSFITDRGLYCYKMMPFGLKKRRSNISKARQQNVCGPYRQDNGGPEKAPRVGPLLSKPKPGEILQLYLAVSNEAISPVLIREEGTTQLPIYYTSKALLSMETRYPDMEKLTLALITASKKLRLYFQAHTIHVLTNFLLRHVLQKLDASGRLLKWAVELSEFDLVFKAKAAIKGQALANFVAKFTNLPEVDKIMEQAKPPTSNVFVDGSAEDVGSKAGVVLISPEGHKLNSTVRFGYKATNNVEEYKTLLAGLRLAKEMQFELIPIPRIENAHVDALSKLASSKGFELLTVIPMEYLLMPSIEAPNVMWVTGTPTWMQPIMAYLKDQVLPIDKHETYKLRGLLFIDDITIARFDRGLQPLAFLEVGCGPHRSSTKRSQHFQVLVEEYHMPVRVPYSIVSDNDRLFDNKKVRSLCEELGIKKHFSTPHYPQGNGQVEAVNKTIKHILKRKLDMSKRAWVDELPQVLWAIRTTARTPTGETPFLMAYGIEAMSPIEVKLPSPRRLHFSEITNDELRRCDLDFIEERRDDAQLKLVIYQRKMMKYFNLKVKKRSFRINDLVLKRVFLSSKEPGTNSLGPNWEGPYKIREEI
ncbi:uncharacterized protein LOC111390542 [Olea europaea var. sylvestris]|uniref:uncharacterized protein LOC111390542 n=1 Tax=Olea europaea var. sylvestris TaxID=158386 RepID=UPI000C1CD900|nr:uncharacterized protein LOC111390542 [Olea europaea var. sylvestris]